MKQKTLTLPFSLLLGLLLLSITGARAGELRIEYGRIWLPPGEEEGFVDVPEGVVLRPNGSALGDIGGASFTLTIGEHSLRTWIGNLRTNSGRAYPDDGWDEAVHNIVVGPCRVTFSKGRLTGSALFSYQLTYPSTAETSTGGSSAAEVEVPADATGDVQVVMESSEDGETWVLAGPGPYPANGSKRKFRLRVVTSK